MANSSLGRVLYKGKSSPLGHEILGSHSPDWGWPVFPAPSPLLLFERVKDILPIVLADEIQSRIPAMRLHALQLEGAKIGVGHRSLDQLRARLLRRMEQWFADHPNYQQAQEWTSLSDFRPGKERLRGGPQGPFFEALEAMAHRAPFPVVNDAVDAARLLSLYYLRPIFLLDAGNLKPPLILLPCPDSFVLPTPQGPVLAPGSLVLADHEKALRSVDHDVLRAPVLESTRSLLLVLVDPGAPKPIDHEEFSYRAANWMESLTKARLVAQGCTPEQA
jgi:DNA/RNA-binding domain of Phe-tRNA-synthetase-like protein